jgi:hypothetical protein
MKKLSITPPEGYEIDKENSSFEKIVFKKVEEKLTYKKIVEKLFKYENHYYIDSNGKIEEILSGWYCPNAAPTEHQLQRLLAINKLMNVAYYLNDGWEPDWYNGKQIKFAIYYNHTSKTIKTDTDICFNSGKVYFKSNELAKQAVEILGEETIKLALGVV